MKRTLRRYGTVVFDCDSTLSAVEGIDELAGAHREQIEALTRAAMAGHMPLEQVYARRLELAAPTRAAVAAIGRRYAERLLPDARPVVAALLAAGVRVRVVSGGLLPAVRVLGQALGLRDDDVAAVDVRFTERGGYAGFDAASPLARTGGKAELLRSWLPRLPRPVMLVGDGATDLEAAPVVDLFVAFAGVVDRPAVTAEAPVVIRSRSLAPVLPLALDARPGEAEGAAVYERGIELMRAGEVEIR